MSWFEKLQRDFDLWKQGGPAHISFDDEKGTMHLSYPDPRIMRREVLINALRGPFAVATASGVLAGAILKALGLL